VIATVINHCN